ncbi:13149_t:CDS:2, partial [Cetraspora pellucida]
MVDAASKQNAFKALNNRFYYGNAKFTMRNKRQDLKLAALGSKKITNYFNLSEEDNCEFSVSELEQKVKKNTQDIRLQYVAQYLRLVKSDFTKQEAKQQEIVFSDRTPKGMRKVLEERGLDYP